MWKMSFPPEVVVGLRSGGGVGEDPIASCLLQGILLEIKGLV
jgi:hypothetical protein